MRSRNKMENLAASVSNFSVHTPQRESGLGFGGSDLVQCISETDIAYCKDDQLPGRHLGPSFRRMDRAVFVAQNSTVTEAPSDEVDDENELPRVTQLTDAHKNAIRAIRKIKYFVARRKFQQARKPYDVRDVIEQYSQGHLNMMWRIKELQRRLDQTLGKPGTYLGGVDKGGHKKSMTVGARLYRVEQQLCDLDKKLDTITDILSKLEIKQPDPVTV